MSIGIDSLMMILAVAIAMALIFGGLLVWSYIDKRSYEKKFLEDEEKLNAITIKDIRSRVASTPLADLVSADNERAKNQRSSSGRNDS